MMTNVLRHRENNVKLITVRLDTSGRAWLQTERNNGAISSALHLHI
jgi:hypothetical protein